MDTSNPSKQAMAMMQAFPNLMNFSKAAYGYEHYLVSSALAGTPADADSNGIIDKTAPFTFDMFAAVNAGLNQFKGFNVPMFLPADYRWYPEFGAVSNVATMKLPDGSDMKLFLTMQLMAQGIYSQEEIQQLVGSYPAFSNGVTLGGHGVAPNPEENALGATASGTGTGCLDCHGAGGILDNPVPVTEKVVVDILPLSTDPEQPFQAEMPVWRWTYYNVGKIIRLGLRTSNEGVADGTENVDIDGNTDLVRQSANRMVLNWFAPGAALTVGGIPLDGGYRRFTSADNSWSLAGTGLYRKSLTWNGGTWMPVLEPVTTMAPNYAVLGYTRDEVIVEDISDLSALPSP
jgi:hypothetical protein